MKHLTMLSITPAFWLYCRSHTPPWTLADVRHTAFTTIYVSMTLKRPWIVYDVLWIIHPGKIMSDYHASYQCTRVHWPVADHGPRTPWKATGAYQLIMDAIYSGGSQAWQNYMDGRKCGRWGRILAVNVMSGDKLLGCVMNGHQSLGPSDSCTETREHG